MKKCKTCGDRGVIDSEIPTVFIGTYRLGGMLIKGQIKINNLAPATEEVICPECKGSYRRDLMVI